MATKVFLLVAAIVAASTPGDDKSKDVDKLQGTWDLKSMEARGKDVKGPATEKITVVFEKDTMTLKGPLAAEKGKDEKPEFPTFRFALDEEKSPKTVKIELLNGPQKGGKGVGIYKLDGDDLWLLLPNGPDAGDPPKEFKTTSESKHALMKLTRAKDDTKKAEKK
jgi:uncharacterized protein (TIGR03067 family)